MIEDLFTHRVLGEIKAEISEKEGVEVFFVGKVDASSQRISSVKACAWGNDDAVAVIFDEAYKGDYVIHNHPSGNLKPSAKDIALSSHFGNLGIGFIIVNNAADEYFTLVRSCDITEISLLDASDISAMLKPGGVISESLKEYEYRAGQIEMAEEVCECFNRNSVAVIEAGTGTGKSLAYLIPSALWSLKNKEKIVISTNTINLQEQLVNKDIPFIKKALNLDFKEVLVKGRGNYACLRKIGKLSEQGELFDDDLSSYKDYIINWANTAKSGTKEELAGLPAGAIWDKIASERDLCIKNACPNFSSCFFFRARKEMVSANVLVVNHHILCSDISIRKNKSDYTSTALLPPYTKVIIDEAHNIEDAVSSFFGSQISRLGLKRNMSKIFKKGKKRNSGALAYLGFKVRNLSIKYPSLEGLAKIEEVIHECYPKVILAAEEIDVFFDKVFNFASEFLSKTPENKLRLTPKIHSVEGYAVLLSEGKHFASILRDISEGLFRIVSLFEDISYYYKENMLGEIREVEAYAERVKGYSHTAEVILSCKNDDEVYWIELGAKNKNTFVYLNMCPVDVGDLIKEYLFNPIDSVVLTSATLSAGKTFDFFKGRVGLDKVEAKKVVERILTSHFDYKEQAMLCIPKDMDDPASTGFDKGVCAYAKKIVEVSRGATFFLCTSFSQIRKIKEYLLSSGEFDSLNILAQGDMDRSLLLEKFKKLDKSILLGTDSFWEGVDVPGDDLKCVVIVKLPFKVPSEPIYQARSEKLEAEGKSSFFYYSLPLSIIKFKQGFGRLIRSSYDEGVVVCLDKRIVTKQYGRYFIDSLPAIPVCYGEEDDVLSSVKKFFR